MMPPASTDAVSSHRRRYPSVVLRFAPKLGAASGATFLPIARRAVSLQLVVRRVLTEVALPE